MKCVAMRFSGGGRVRILVSFEILGNSHLPLLNTCSMTSMTDQAELLASLERHNTTFTTLLSLIPSRFYAAPDPDEVRPSPCSRVESDRLCSLLLPTLQADSRWMKNKKRKTGEEIKESKRRAKHEKAGRGNGSLRPS